MSFNTLQVRNSENLSAKAKKTVAVFEKLLSELQARTVPEHIENAVNQSIERINSAVLPENQLIKLISKNHVQILHQVQNELKWVPKNHYRNVYALLGMSGIGVPIGVAFGMAVNNLGLLGLGFPIGMAIGFAIGTAKDKKAAAENRQLDLDV